MESDLKFPFRAPKWVATPEYKSHFVSLHCYGTIPWYESRPESMFRDNSYYNHNILTIILMIQVSRTDVALPHARAREQNGCHLRYNIALMRHAVKVSHFVLMIIIACSISHLISPGASVGLYTASVLRVPNFYTQFVSCCWRWQQWRSDFFETQNVI